MTYMVKAISCFLLSGLFVFDGFFSMAQGDYSPPDISPSIRAYDSLLFSQVPLIDYGSILSKETLPVSIDNRNYPWFKGFTDQMPYFACLQVSSCTYMLGYEINRLRNRTGSLSTNTYPFLYTWTYFNQGINTGVSSFHSFHTIRNQGHMNQDDMGPDSLTSYTGWASGYDKYYRAMTNRMKRVRGIRVDSEEGINLVRNYLVNHLDGSSSGGLVNFTSNVVKYKTLPTGTPEAGTPVITALGTIPSHGFTTVGYHDSIRYDLNGDGQFTNNLDINGDGVVNVRDWEIGGFRQVESYFAPYIGSGFFYILYSTIAKDFSDGGPWNNTVYLIDADTAYRPLLTMKVKMEYNLRGRIKVMAGVSRNLESTSPEHLIDFPVFNFQGGDLPMRGFSNPGDELIEFGLDVTPLLSYIEPEVPARFFLVVEERDSNQAGYGTINELSFFSYGKRLQEFISPQTYIQIADNGITFASATGTVNVDQPVIADASIPPLQPGQPLAVQMYASGGAPPYTWSLLETYYVGPGNLMYQPITDQPLSLTSPIIPYVVVPLPFSFPFFGKHYDTLYVNKFGMIQFTPQVLPYPWVADGLDMLRNIKSIAVAFSSIYEIHPSSGGGMWMRANSDSVSIRWKVGRDGTDPLPNFEFMATLFPDGNIETCFGPMESGQYNPVIYSGIANGDGSNAMITPHFNIRKESGTSTRYYPLLTAEEISISEEGLLSIKESDSSKIFDLVVQVTDGQDISASKTFTGSSGLEITQELSDPNGIFRYGEEYGLNLTLTNRGTGTLSPVEVLLSSQDPDMVITNSLVTVSQLVPGVPLKLNNLFLFSLIQPLPDQRVIPFTITVTSGNKTWRKPFYLRVSAPEIEFNNYYIEDGVDKVLDVGETAFLTLSISNRGSLPASGLSVKLTCMDSYVAVLSEDLITGLNLNAKESQEVKFLLHALPETPLHHSANLILQIFNDDISIEVPLSLKIGNPPVALVTLSSSSASAGVISPLLDSLGIEYALLTSIPETAESFSLIFIFTGTSPYSYLLNGDELDKIREYLEQGGKVYMENYRGWYAGGQTSALPTLFKYWHRSVPVYYYDSLFGMQGTPSEGMEFLYTGAATSIGHEIVPLPEGTCFFENNDPSPKCIAFGYDGEDYKTIGTFSAFSDLSDATPPSTKAELLQRYLDFFDLNLHGPFPLFHATSTRVCRSGSVQFMDDSYPDVLARQWEFPGGIPSTSTEVNPVVTYNSPGVFDAILKVSGNEGTYTMHKKAYIRAFVCSEIPESVSMPSCMLFPNPASDKVTLRITGDSGCDLQITLTDLHGREIRTWQLVKPNAVNECTLSISGIPRGIYFLRIRFLTAPQAIPAPVPPQKLIIYE